ncbi:MAG: cytotoxin [Candidatus Magasanikbacteria bacterium]|nr:cytotoxin [Candidatus Magasanikbacteria bacterium]
MLVNLSPRFTRSYNNLPRHIQENFKIKIQIFIQDPRHPALKTHKLKGRLQECLAFRLQDGYRVLFEFSSTDTVNLLDIGPHDIYRKY